MRNFYKYIFLILLTGCSTATPKDQLLGNWYAKTGNVQILEFEFYKDSLVIYDIFGRYSQKWKINDQKILLSRINGPTNKKELTYEYRLNQSKQLLHLKIAGNDTVVLPVLRKAENAFDFLQKLRNIKIDLPITQSELKPIGQPENLNFNIYAGYKNSDLVVKTDSATNLNNLENEVTKFKDNSRKEIRKHLRFNLIADKNISESEIDSIKDRLKKTSIEIIVRTYKRNQSDYENALSWYGKFE